MARLIELEDHEIETITEMLREYRGAVMNGSISGFGQSKEAEIIDTDLVIGKLERAKMFG